MHHQPYPPLPLKPALYNLLDEGEKAFLRAQTGIQDDGELRDHVLRVQAEAYAVRVYPCIRVFDFARGQISTYPAYPQAIALGKARKGAIYLDLGCCMGSDLRKAISDGFPRENVIASDIVPEFWALGHKLFKSNTDTFPVPFVLGDIFNNDFLSPSLSPTAKPSLPPTPPPLSTLSSLTPLRHCVSVIHTSMLFHLFDEEKQRTLANKLASLLSPAPGSMIFGMHFGAIDSEEYKNGGTRFSIQGTWIFAHSPASWKSLWTGENGVFKADEATVAVTVRETPSADMLPEGAETPTMYTTYWCVTRL